MPQPEAPLVEVRGVTKDYHGLRPLRVEQLTLTSGDSVALLGFDQQMAQVLVDLLMGIIVPDAGEVRILGSATTAIPIVAAGADAEPQDITPQNLAHPTRNITGVISIGAEMDGKRMELLHEAVPAIARVATFWDCNSRNFARCILYWR